MVSVRNVFGESAKNAQAETIEYEKTIAEQFIDGKCRVCEWFNGRPDR